MSSNLNHLSQLGFKSAGRIPMTNECLPNVVAGFGAFHVSYNTHSSDYGCDTTALVLQQRVFFVLNGNHAAALHAAAESTGIQGCIDYFINHMDQANPSSEHLMATKLRSDIFGLHRTTLEVIGKTNIDRIASAAIAGQQAG